MKGRERNSAFFQQGKADSSSISRSGGLSRLYKTAKETGKLNLSSRSLTDIPNEIFSLEKTLEEGEKFWEINPLTRLDLSSNVISNIPAGKFLLLKSDLNYLKFRDNRLASLPDDLFSCDQLRYLDLSLNKLRSIPEDIGELIALQELVLSDNELNTVPISISECKSLQTLELQNNVISTIPIVSFLLPQLVKLNLSSNKMSVLPSTISGLTRLGERACLSFLV
jgi:internalin A